MFRDERNFQKWLRFCNCGEPISGTPFLAFKVPIHKSVQRIPYNDRFMFEDIFRLYPNIGLVIDLTNTTRYYNRSVVADYGATYVKIAVKGHGSLPNNRDIREFNRVVDDFLRNHGRNHLIGVHCTHGVNRTGFMICQYMMSRFGMSAQSAISRFELARYHSIERPSYVDALYRMDNDNRSHYYRRDLVHRNQRYQRDYRHRPM